MNGIIRIGRVSDINMTNREVRVYFPDTRMVSGWLRVIDNTPKIQSATGSTSGGSGEASFSAHSHSIGYTAWFPAINDTVLCIYDTSFNSDGYVLGGL